MNGDRLAEYLDHMSTAARDACGFVEGMSLSEFLSDKRTQQAVVMSLVIVGETAARIMGQHPGFASTHPTIPWRGMRGMRNRIAHGYFDIDLNVVWDTVQTALPELLRQLSPFRDPP